MAAAKLSVKVVTLGSWGQQMELISSPTDDSLKTIADLKGKTIGLTKGSDALPVLIRLLNRAKLPFSETSIKFISAEDMTKGFNQPNLGIDAMIATQHLTAVPVTKGTAKIFLGNAEIVKSIGYIGASTLVGRQSLINDDPSLVQKTVNAWIKALHYIQQDPDDAARLLVIFFHRQGIRNISLELTKSWVNMVRYDRYLWEPADTTDAEYNGWGLREAGVLKELPKLKGYIDNRFAKKALAKLEKASEKTGGRQ
jgi:ABC-type nitrate/sulfonate/bicarbonate transport system substrate-binding protein